jgi:tetratricopeptide (TPR) repeat protein
MIGEDRADVLQIDGPPTASKEKKGSSKKKGKDAKEVVILGYDGTGEAAVGVATKPAKSKKSEASVPSHLFCLKDTCRFFQKQSGACKFDSIFDITQEHSAKIDVVEKHAARIEAVEGHVEKIDKIDKIDAVDEILKKIDAVEAQLKKAESAKDDKGPDKTAAKVTKDLDKFWKFQTKSVSELIASIGETEKNQQKSFTDFKKEFDKSLESWKPDVDLKALDDVKGGLHKLEEAVESREDGIENFSTTISELVINLDDSLKILQEKSGTLAERIEKLESAVPQPQEFQKKFEETLSDKLENMKAPDISSDIKSIGDGFKDRIDDLLGAHKRVEESLETWRGDFESRVKELRENQDAWKEPLERIENKQAEVIELVQHVTRDNDRLEDESTTLKKKEAKKFNNLGVTSFHNGEFELARDQFLEAVSLDPRFAESWNNLGLVYTEMQDEEGATEAFSKAVEINPDLPAAYNNLGYIFYKQGSYGQAIEMYNEALGRTADNSSAYTNLGNAYFKQGNEDDARRAWEKALEIDPGNEKANRNLKRLDKE